MQAIPVIALKTTTLESLDVNPGDIVYIPSEDGYGLALKSAVPGDSTKYLLRRIGAELDVTTRFPRPLVVLSAEANLIAELGKQVANGSSLREAIGLLGIDNVGCFVVAGFPEFTGGAPLPVEVCLREFSVAFESERSHRGVMFKDWHLIWLQDTASKIGIL